MPGIIQDIWRGNAPSRALVSPSGRERPKYLFLISRSVLCAVQYTVYVYSACSRNTSFLKCILRFRGPRKK
jgi:hypothetical protein